MAIYTVRLEHGRRRKHADIEISPAGPMVPAYLEHPVGVTYATVYVEDRDDEARMDQEARNLAVAMTSYPADMVTKADIVDLVL